jgi:hypothetical protein
MQDEGRLVVPPAFIALSPLPQGEGRGVRAISAYTVTGVPDSLMANASARMTWPFNELRASEGDFII